MCAVMQVETQLPMFVAYPRAFLASEWEQITNHVTLRDGIEVNGICFPLSLLPSLLICKLPWVFLKQSIVPSHPVTTSYATPQALRMIHVSCGLHELVAS